MNVAHRAKSHRGEKTNYRSPRGDRPGKVRRAPLASVEGEAPGGNAHRNLDSTDPERPDNRQGGTCQSPGTRAKVPGQKAKPGGKDEMTYTECTADEREGPTF